MELFAAAAALSSAGSNTVRVGEARFIRKLLDAELQSNPEARIFVCGDFNDTWNSSALKTIVGDGSTAMHCFASELTKEQKITYNKEPYRSMIDFVLCSPALPTGIVFQKAPFPREWTLLARLGGQSPPGSLRSVR